MMDMDDGYILWTGIWKGEFDISMVIATLTDLLLWRSSWELER